MPALPYASYSMPALIGTDITCISVSDNVLQLGYMKLDHANIANEDVTNAEVTIEDVAIITNNLGC